TPGAQSSRVTMTSGRQGTHPSEARVPRALIAFALVLGMVACRNSGGRGEPSSGASAPKAEPRSSTAPPAPVDSGATPRFNASAWNLPDEDLLGFAEIPAGKFPMGSDKTHDSQAQDDELP